MNAYLYEITPPLHIPPHPPHPTASHRIPQSSALEQDAFSVLRSSKHKIGNNNGLGIHYVKFHKIDVKHKQNSYKVTSSCLVFCVNYPYNLT